MDELDNAPETADMAELIIKITEELTKGMVKHDDKLAMMVFISILKEFAMELERNYSGIDSNNGTININLN